MDYFQFFLLLAYSFVLFLWNRSEANAHQFKIALELNGQRQMLINIHKEIAVRERVYNTCEKCRLEKEPDGKFYVDYCKKCNKWA